MAVYYFMPGTLGTLQWQYIISCQVHWVPYRDDPKESIGHVYYAIHINEV
jgi:hypothetical protein